MTCTSHLPREVRTPGGWLLGGARVGPRAPSVCLTHVRGELQVHTRFTLTGIYGQDPDFPQDLGARAPWGQEGRAGTPVVAPPC